jgi:hypothetical protein
MFQWAWGLVKRHPTRALVFGGITLLTATAIHAVLLSLTIRWHESVDVRAATSSLADLMISAAYTDLMCAVVAFVMLVTGMLRLCRGKR